MVIPPRVVGVDVDRGGWAEVDFTGYLGSWVGDVRDVRVRWRRWRFSSQKGEEGSCGRAINAGQGVGEFM